MFLLCQQYWAGNKVFLFCWHFFIPNLKKYFSTGNYFPSRKSDVLSNRLTNNGIRPNTLNDLTRILKDLTRILKVLTRILKDWQKSLRIWQGSLQGSLRNLKDSFRILKIPLGSCPNILKYPGKDPYKDFQQVTCRHYCKFSSTQPAVMYISNIYLSNYFKQEILPDNVFERVNSMFYVVSLFML